MRREIQAYLMILALCVLGYIVGTTFMTIFGCGSVHIHSYEIHKYQTTEEASQDEQKKPTESVWERI